MAETIRDGESPTQFTIRRIRNEILEEAANEMERHGEYFNKNTKMGEKPSVRTLEAYYHAELIRGMKDV